ncbi:MAG: NAD(P)-dependent oxidoreductase [Sphingomonadaceae bacterium]|nr:NAD(P)-dependent oxidoreductase [Sphingomonadaceae bacterium]
MQVVPEKRDVQARKADFLEIARPFLIARAEEQASRCSQCGVPFCQVHCPLHNNIPDWLRLTAEGRFEEAYEASAATSTMPEICGRICPQDRLCEGNCVIEADFGSVTIGAVEKFINDLAWDSGWVRPLRVGSARGQSVGIIGAGPAGLTAAEMLRTKGYGVDIYDRHDRPGGLLTYGIPGFKLEKHVVARRIERLAAAGITFHPSIEIGRDLTLGDLRARHDAVLIATGMYAARALAVAGAKAAVPALDYLFASNRRGFGDAVTDLDAAGKDVIVVGGGDTAMDCVRTAVRQGARSVRCLYRRDRANMPGSQREVAHAEEEGVEFIWLASPAALVGDPVVAVDIQRMRLGPPDASGRRSPEPDAARERLSADMVIGALGFDAEDLPTMFAARDLATTRWGTLRVDHATMMTSLPGVFAAGDIVRGASLVVWAIRDGRDVAKAMHDWLAARAAGARVAA